MKKKNLFIIAGILFVVLIAMCVGIYFLIKNADKIKLKDDKNQESIVEEEIKIEKYTSRGVMKLYNDYLVEISDNNLKIMDYKTNIIVEENYEEAKYIEAYYGIDNNIYVVTSNDYEKDTEKVNNFKLSKVVDKEIEHILDYNCKSFHFLNNDKKQVLGIVLDDNKEIIFYDGRYVNLNDYTISSLKVVETDAYGFAYNNENIIVNKCSLDVCSFAILNVSDGKILPVSYDSIAALDNGNYRVKENGYYGIVSNDGSVVLESIYDYIDISNKDVILAFKNNKMVVMNTEYKIINKEEIDMNLEIPTDIDSAIYGNYKLVYASLVGDNYFIDGNDKENNYKLYIVNKDGNVEVKENIKSFTYDSVLEEILIYDWIEEDESDKDVKEVWNKNLEKLDNTKKEWNFKELTISVDSKHQATITQNGEIVDEFYYDDETIITEEYFLYYNSLKEETYYYYSV
ncbi:MAG: hypothetical protein ACI31M_04365 [Bacilli bacterium]